MTAREGQPPAPELAQKIRAGLAHALHDLTPGGTPIDAVHDPACRRCAAEAALDSLVALAARLTEERDGYASAEQSWMTTAYRWENERDAAVRDAATLREALAAIRECRCNGCNQPAKTWGPICSGMTQGDYTHFHSPEWWITRALAAAAPADEAK